MADPASPFDLSTYLAFPASAGGMGHLGMPSAGASNNGGTSNGNGNGNGNASANNASGNGGNASANGNGNGDEYRNFAKGIQMTQMGKARQQQQASQQGQAQQQPRQTPRMASVQLDSQATSGQAQQDRPPSRDVKASPRTSTQDTPSSATNHLSPYGLDPAAFQSEVRFQLPAFLNPNVSAPTHPGGAEAWSGYGLNAASAMEGMYNATAAGAPLAFPRSGGGGGQGMQGGGYGQGAFGQGFGYDAGFGMDMGKGVDSGMPGDAQSWENWTFNNGDFKGLTPTANGVFNFGNNGVVTQQPQSQAPAQQTFRASDKSAQSAQQDTPNSSAMPTSALLPSGASGWPSAQSAQTQGERPYGNTNAFASSSALGSTAPAAAILAQSNNLNGMVQPDTLAVTNQTPANGNGSMPGLYSQTGFDMVGVLARVAARRDPKTVLGPVDFSCSFLVVDIRKFDHPIVYASPTFQTLTGYSANEIVGKNCRFLQSPDGEVARGSRRKYTDNVAVSHLKRMLLAGKECQASLINYRKGGTPFINLVTVVPIPWDSDEIVYHVGFQVDLVEQPNAILRNMRDGTYQVNYTVLSAPAPPLRPAATKPAAIEHVPTQTGLTPEILEILGPKAKAAIYSGVHGEDSGKIEWIKCVLDQMDDFMLVLSLKGQFQYVAPSVRRVLEYDPDDLLGKQISDICHPSDIVPVMRELKDSTHSPGEGQSPRLVNLLFRVRRKRSGYVWLECTGRLHVEAGKGRKAVILSGRERAMSNLSWSAIDSHGGLADLEFWARLSFDGMILWTSEQVAEVLGTRLEDVVGRSFFSFLQGGRADVAPPSAYSRKDPHPSAAAIEAALVQASSGLPKKGAIPVQHQLVGEDGRIVHVTSIFYAVVSASDVFDTGASNTPDSGDSEALGGGVHIGVAGCPPSQIVVQIKVTSPPSAGTRLMQHETGDNVFEELDTTRGTSWQYEIHQLKTANRRLREEIRIVQSGLKNKFSDPTGANARKRKSGADDMVPVNNPVPVPRADHPAPLHQQSLGFGLAPAQPSSYGW